MKKILKRINIFSFVLGAIIFGSIGVYATMTYNASQIMYTKSNNQEITLDSALNELYTETNKDMYTRLNLSSSNVSTPENNYHSSVIMAQAIKLD